MTTPHERLSEDMSPEEERQFTQETGLRVGGRVRGRGDGGGLRGMILRAERDDDFWDEPRWAVRVLADLGHEEVRYADRLRRLS